MSDDVINRAIKEAERQGYKVDRENPVYSYKPDYIFSGFVRIVLNLINRNRFTKLYFLEMDICVV